MSNFKFNEELKTKIFNYKFLNDDFLDSDGKIREELKFKINNPAFKIQNSKLIGSPEDKFETTLFLPEGEGRKGEGGLRTKGYFKFSYVWCGDSDGDCVGDSGNGSKGGWWIADYEENPLVPAPEEIQEKISQYINSLSSNAQSSGAVDTYSTSQINVRVNCDGTGNISTFKDHNSPFTNHYSLLNKLPLITVITVVYNGEKYLEETIQSVINQTYPNVEYIIIDGGSTDGTIDIIKKYEDYVDYWVSEKDGGIYDAMNKGIDLSTGTWINFMNAGDIFITNKVLKDSLKIFTINDIAIIYSDVIVKFGDYGVLKKAYNINKINYFMPFQHQCSFTKSSIIKECKFDTNFKLAADYDLFLSQYQKGKKFYYLNKPIAEVSSGGVSDSQRNLVRKEYYSIQKKNNVAKFKNRMYYYYFQNLEYIKKITKFILPNFIIKYIRKTLG